MAGPTATFHADFTKWDAALKDATVKLKSFEVAAGNVGQQLKRAFSTFSGEKIIRDANLAVEAVKKLGGAAHLTASEQTRLNATLTEALAKYKALGQVAPKEMQDLANATKQVVAPTEAATASVGALVLKYASIGAAIALATKAIGGLVDFLSSSVTSYAQAEAAQNRMVAALRAQGTATPAVIKQYTELAATIQRTTAFSDDAAAEMISLFTAIGNVAPKEMGKATKAAADLAAGLGIDLVQAATLVAKAMEGNTGALGRYGIKIDQAKVAAEGADAIFGAINERFGGQAVSQLDTYAGRLAQITNLWDDFKEAVGKAIVEDESIQQLMKDAPAIITAMTSAIGLFAEGIRQAHGAWKDFQNAITFGAFKAKEGFLEARDAAREAKIAMDLLGRETPMVGTFRDVELKAPEIPAILPKGLRTGETIETIDAALRKTTVSQIAASKAAEATAKAYKAWALSVTGLDKAMKAAELEANLKRLTAEGKLTATATQAIITEYEQLRPSLDRLSQPLEELRTNYQDVLESTRAYGAAQAMVNARTLPDAARMFEVGQTAVEQYGVRLKYLESTSIDLVVAMNAIPGAVESTAVAAEVATRSLGQSIGTSLKTNLLDAVSGIPELITQGILHDASWEEMAISIASMIGAALGAAIGGALAGPAGAQIGAALGSLLGPLLDAVWQTRAEETQERIRTEFGVSISEGLAQAIEDAAADFAGNREAAKLFNLDRIIAEGGGLTVDNIDEMFSRLHDVYSMMETGAFNAADAQKVLNDNFKTFADFVTHEGALASRELLEIIRLNNEMGTQSAAVAEFVTAQVTTALGGLTMFLENAQVTSQAAAEGIAASVFGAFEALTAQGASPLEAIKQITPVLEQLDAQLREAGFSGGAAFDSLRAMAALATDEVKGPMIEAITGLGVALEGLHNSGVLNQEMFAGLSTQITDTYNKLIAEGADGAQALALVAPSLQTLFELQQDFGYAVDDATQKLIDQAVEAGHVGDEHRSVQERMMLAMDRTAEAVEYLAEQLGYVAEGATTAADEMATVPDKYLEAMKTATPEMKAEYEVWLAEAEGFASKAGDEVGAIPDKYLGALENATPEMQEQFQAWLAASENAFSGVEDAATVAADGVVDEFTNAAQRTREALDKIPDELKIKVNYDVERLPNPDYGTPGGGERPEAYAGYNERYARGYAKGGVVYAQHGMWAPRGTDTVPAMLTPGEVVLPRDVVSALRSSPSSSVTVHLTISTIDGADVERVVKSADFRRALTSAVSGNVGGVRTDLRTAIGVR